MYLLNPREQVANITPFCSRILGVHLLKTRTFPSTVTVQLPVLGRFPLLQNCYLIYKSHSNVAYRPDNVLLTNFPSGPGCDPGARVPCRCYVPSVSLSLELPQPLFQDTNIFEGDGPVVLWNFPWVRSVWCFLVIGFGLCLFGRNAAWGMLWLSRCLESGGSWRWLVPWLGVLTLIAGRRCRLPGFSTAKLFVFGTYSLLYLCS